MLSALPALIVVVIRRQMPESDVWLQSVKSGVSQQPRLRRGARPDARPGAAEDDGAGVDGHDVQHGGLLVQDDLAADLPARDPRPVARTVAWLLLMDQIGSLVGYVAFGFASDSLRPASQLHASSR